MPGTGRPVATPEAPSAYRSSLPWRLFDGLSTRIDRRYGWDRLPLPLGLAVLVGLRNELRKKNLHDANLLPSTGQPPIGPPPTSNDARTADGTYNDLDDPRMGMAGSRFGRNVALAAVDADPQRTMMEPSPREVSRRLLTRHEFAPATTVNAIVAAWLQFMIKDWFSHGPGDAAHAHQVPLSADDPWPEHPMAVPRIVPDPTRPAGAAGPPTSVNALTHWWDLSSIYGTTPEEAARFRTGEGGKLRIEPGGVVPLPADDPAHDPTREPGWWVGMGMLISLFALEHNAICDRLRADHPQWTDDQLFTCARLVNAAVVAKIHTVEWTPAVISHPITRVAMRANWFGIAGERLRRRFGRISASEVVSGIPGSPTNHYGVPYSLTEEFTSVYRMHPLVPDDYPVKSVATGETLRTYAFPELTGGHSRDVFFEVSLADLFYSFGTEYAGAIVLHNFPRGLQEFVRPDGRLMDLAAVDILRVRELGVPRYNDFRRQLRMKPAASFEELSDDAETVATLREVYGDVEKVDLMVGMFAEKRPKGFAFSDTAFRIFILMASRRLNSDRFFTKDYDARVYTEAGIEWIDDATMARVLLRHFPELAPALDPRANAFAPWHRP
ncbi:peroxidase family protein [Motilibacter deserti]|uniref:Heme peroxidase n=1 Tax=Motilibacter deserti TaxID=2714956 RepID=A0ABX0GXR1_9ACTN|nr:peroxidase family protein [Motilibacter deserti]NHC15739.1 heme peroxidase [Motilibacter deserti]